MNQSAIEFKPIDVLSWIEENKSNFFPPICNKLMHNDQLKVFFVGGPNKRLDYHIELGEEGDMCLKVIERGAHKSIHIRQGEAFLLPARIAHSPQRKANTIGLVIERRRKKDELDGIRYYMDGTKDILYERWFHCTDLETQLPPIIKVFFESNEYKAGVPSSNSRLIEAPYLDDSNTCNVDPITLSKWLKCYEEEIDERGYKALFDELRFASRIHIYGGDFKHLISSNDNQYESFLWQMIRTANVQLENQQQWIQLKTSHCLKVPPNTQIKLETQSGSFTLVLSMPTE